MSRTPPQNPRSSIKAAPSIGAPVFYLREPGNSRRGRTDADDPLFIFVRLDDIPGSFFDKPVTADEDDLCFGGRSGNGGKYAGTVSPHRTDTEESFSVKFPY